MKRFFSMGYCVLAGLASVAAFWGLTRGGDPVWAGVLLAALPPLVQRVAPFDRTPSIHHKVRLPRVSLLVLLGTAWVLLSVPGRHPALWWVLASLGGFLLDTYWAREDATA